MAHCDFMLLYAPNWLFVLPGAAFMFAGLGARVLVAARPRASRRDYAGVHDDDFRRNFYFAGRADTFDWEAFAEVFSYAERLIAAGRYH